KVTFTSLDRIWIASLASGGPRDVILTPRRGTSAGIGEFFSTGSPDGRFILYATWAGEGGGGLFCMRADGSNGPERLTQERGFFTKPAYSADGSEIIAVHGTAQAFRISASTWSRLAIQPMDMVRLPASGGPIRSLVRYGVPDQVAWYW